MFYDVVFINPEGKRKVEQQEAANAGSAFAKCLKSHPDSKLVSAHIYRRALGNCEMWMDYEPPSTVRVIPLKSEKRVQVEMELDDPRKLK